MGLACIAALALQTPGALAAHAQATNDVAGRQSSLAKVIVRLSLKYHYPAVKIDEDFSRRVLTRYIDTLDPGRFYFTRRDVAAIHAAFDKQLGTDLRTGNLEAARAIHGLYMQRKKQLFALALQLLEEKPDLHSPAHYRVAREDAPRPGDNAALERLWRKRIDNEVLDRLLRGENLDSARAELKSRYGNPSVNTDAGAFDRYMNAFMGTLDPHSRYVTARQAGDPEGGTGLAQPLAGARLINRNGYVTFVRPPLPGNSLHHNDLVNGDSILGMQPKPGGKTVFFSGWSLEQAITAIRRTAGTPARLLVRTPGPPGLQHTRWVRMPGPDTRHPGQRAEAYIDFARDGAFQYKIGVIRIPGFYRGVESDSSGHGSGGVAFDVAYLIRLLKRKGVSALLLDMRGNPGGSLTEALSMTGLFMPSGDPVVDIRTRFGSSRHVSLNRHGGIAWRGPLGILVNRGSASATELFCGALKDYGRAIILGARTWGKGTIQTLIPLAEYTRFKNPGELKLTTAEFFRPDGESPQRRGILPDIALPSASSIFAAGEAAYANALPATSLPPLRYTPMTDNVAPPLKRLRTYFGKDLAKGKTVKLYEREIGLLRESGNSTSVVLDLQARRHMFAESDARWLKLENDWRSTLGEPPLGDLSQAGRTAFRMPDIPLRLAIRLMGKFAGVEPSIGLDTDDLRSADAAKGYQCRYLPLIEEHRISLCTPGSRQIFYAPGPHSSGKAGTVGPRRPDGGEL